MCFPIKFIYYTWYVICTHGYYFFILSGLGHYEINMVKSVVNFLWKVAFEDLGKMLGFKSPTALASLRAWTGKTCISLLHLCKQIKIIFDHLWYLLFWSFSKDHHKSWQALQIFLHAVSEELVTPYVQQCESTYIHPSLRGYYEWLHSSQLTLMYEFMREVVFTYCLSMCLEQVCGATMLMQLIVAEQSLRLYFWSKYAFLHGNIYKGFLDSYTMSAWSTCVHWETWILQLIG